MKEENFAYMQYAGDGEEGRKKRTSRRRTLRKTVPWKVGGQRERGGGMLQPFNAGLSAFPRGIDRDPKEKASLNLK